MPVSLSRLTSLAVIFKNQWLLAFGFAFLIAWPWVISSTTIFYSGSLAIGSTTWSGSNFAYLFLSMTGICAAIFFRQCESRITSIWAHVFAAACYVFTATAFWLLSFSDADIATRPLFAVFYVWPLFCGCGQAILYLSWIRSIGLREPSTSIAVVLLAAVIAAFLLLLINNVNHQIRLGCSFLVGPMASLFLYLVTRIGSEQSGKLSVTTSNVEAAPIRMPAKLLFSIFAAGLVFGMFQGAMFSGVFGQNAWGDFGAPAFLVASILFALCALLLKVNYNSLMYKFSFVVMSFGAVCVSLLFAWGQIGYGVFCVGYRFFECVVWSLCAYLIYCEKIHPIWIGGLSIGSLWLGRFAGFELLTALEYSNVYLPFEDFTIIVVFALLTAALLLSSHNNLLEAWGMRSPAQVDPLILAERKVCARISSERKLTAREGEILELVVQEKSRSQIADELCLSPETVKTHLSHIYQKCSVKSKAELIGLVKRSAKMLELGVAEK